MNLGHQVWRIVALAGLLAVLAPVVGQPLFLFAGAAVGALLEARQWSFFTGCTAAETALSVDLELSAAHVKQRETTAATLRVTLDEPATVDTTVTVPTPLSAECVGEALSVTLSAGETAATATTQYRWPTAGSGRVDQPTVRFASRDGLFSQRLRRGPTPEVTVEPPTPGTVHVGKGGDRIDASFGAHRTGQFGQGIDPAQLRQYVPGDDVGDIDWKATARQGEPHVREYEVETDRRTVILFDHSEATAVGQAGEQAIAALRETALAVALAAADAGDPLALYAVGDEGLTSAFEPATGPAHYRSIRTALQECEPTTAASRASTTAQAASSPGGVQAKVNSLGADSTTFASTLRPYLQHSARYIQRIEGEPLFDVARTRITQLRGDAQTLVFTTDSDRARLRETVKLLAGETGDVGVFLAPRVLFEEGAMADLESTYDDYTEFEAFRRNLARLDRVVAYEVAPGDRLTTVLEVGRDS